MTISRTPLALNSVAKTSASIQCSASGASSALLSRIRTSPWSLVLAWPAKWTTSQPPLAEPSRRRSPVTWPSSTSTLTADPLRPAARSWIRACSVARSSPEPSGRITSRPTGRPAPVHGAGGQVLGDVADQQYRSDVPRKLVAAGRTALPRAAPRGGGGAGAGRGRTRGLGPTT